MAETLVNLDYRDDVAHVTWNNPPVNAFSLALRERLLAVIREIELKPGVRAVVLRGAGRCFSAGADIREFGTPAVTAAPRLTLHVHPAIENLRVPVIAAIHGMAIGGGLETAMACHYRIACADALIALPEVALGVIPISGTQRLPHLIPLAGAIDLILTGVKRQAREFAGTPLFDEVLDCDSARALDEAAHALALRSAAGAAPLTRVRDRPILEASGDVLRAAWEKLAPGLARGAHAEALRAIAAAVESTDFEAGLQAATAICERLLATDEVRDSAQRFIAERAAR
jgi:enoyl-CoA hydratase/carnithine racemase